MNPTICSISLLFILCLGHGCFGQLPVILDTDFGGDADDLGALAMLHHFMDNDECELLAVMCWSTEKYAVPAIDAVNRYYGHPDIPVGVRKDGVYHESWTYGKPIADQLPYELTYQKAYATTVLYRQILEEAADSSIVIITVGPLKNIENLMRSQPDSISRFSGKELIANKVKEFVIMGGQYPTGAYEWNFDGGMKGVTRNVIENLSVPMTFIGYEIGVNIKTGEVLNQLDPGSPLYIGFMHFSEHAPWIKEQFKGEILDNATYDQTAVLYAVRNGTGNYWTKVHGTCVPDESGGNKWLYDDNSSNAYLKLRVDNEFMAQLIESLMLGEF